MRRVVYLGPENSYSYIAAKAVSESGDTLFERLSFADVLSSVRRGDADMAVVPLENSVEGNVGEVTDGLIFDDGVPLFINAEIVVKIDNFLIAKKGARVSDIKKIVTHWQPYAQCRTSVRRILPNAIVAFVESTSAAVKAIMDTETAALGGRQLLDREHIVLGDSVNDSKTNCTRFAVVSRDDTVSDKNDKLTIVFEAENKPGGLLRLLEIINAFGMNMTRIESRPQKSALGRYIFIADIKGNILDKDIASAFALIKRNTAFFKYLGCYKSSPVVKDVL